MNVDINAASSQPISEQIPDPLQYQSRLRFPPALEAAYRENYAERAIATQRQFIGFGFIIFGLFGILDLYAMPRTLWAAWVLRAIGETVTLALFGLSFRRWIRTEMYWLINLWLLVVSAMVLGMVGFAQQSELAFTFYPIGLLLILICGYAASGHLWYATAQGWLTVIGYVLVGIFDQRMTVGQSAFLKFFTLTFFMVAMNLIGMVLAFALERTNRLAFLQWLVIDRQRRESDRLLLNVLPASVAERLKRGEVVADQFEQVGILFADIAGFTPYSADKRPAEVVEMLNQVFSAFDGLTEKYGLEKVKTIGDAYMVVSGLQDERPHHLQELADMALEMQALMRSTSAFRLRVGIHAGPVVAGIIGFKKFSYDLWGDTVNVASRMESFGVPGEVQVTSEVYDLLREKYRLEMRGPVNIKGKGDMQVYLLKGPLEAPELPLVGREPALMQ